MDVKLKEKADLKSLSLEAELQMKLDKIMQCSDAISTKVDNTAEMAATLGKVKTNLEGTKAEVIELKSRLKDKEKDISRMKDEKIKTIHRWSENHFNELRESNELQIAAKEEDQAEHESLEMEIRSKLLQSLSVPVPEEQVHECPACMEKMKPPLEISVLTARLLTLEGQTVWRRL